MANRRQSDLSYREAPYIVGCPCSHAKEIKLLVWKPFTSLFAGFTRIPPQEKFPAVDFDGNDFSILPDKLLTNPGIDCLRLVSVYHDPLLGKPLKICIWRFPGKVSSSASVPKE